MKSEEPQDSVVPVKQDSIAAIAEPPPSEYPVPTGCGATGKHDAPERKRATGSKATTKTAAPMLSAKAKRVSHRRQIRRSHANG